MYLLQPWPHENCKMFVVKSILYLLPNLQTIIKSMKIVVKYMLPPTRTSCRPTHSELAYYNNNEPRNTENGSQCILYHIV